MLVDYEGALGGFFDSNLKNTEEKHCYRFTAFIARHFDFCLPINSQVVKNKTGLAASIYINFQFEK